MTAMAGQMIQFLECAPAGAELVEIATAWNATGQRLESVAIQNTHGVGDVRRFQLPAGGQRRVAAGQLGGSSEVTAGQPVSAGQVGRLFR